MILKVPRDSILYTGPKLSFLPGLRCVEIIERLSSQSPLLLDRDFVPLNYKRTCRRTLAPPAMETFEAQLAKATNLDKGDMLGAVAIIIDNNGETSHFPTSVEMHMKV